MTLAVDPATAAREVASPAQQEAFVRQLEIDPSKYYPPDVNRPLVTEMPSTIDMAKSVLKAKVETKIEGAEESLASLRHRVAELEQKLKDKHYGR